MLKFPNANRPNGRRTQRYHKPAVDAKPIGSPRKRDSHLMVATALKVTPYARRHRRAVLSLVNDGRCRLHTHLDWQLIEDWLDMPDVPVMLCWQDARLIGVMAAAPPLSGRGR